MARTRIKICGVMRVEDALATADAGADAIGMVLHADAPRTISLDRAREIVAALPPFVTPVGVFVDAPTDFIRQSAQFLHLDHVQLHGNETPEQALALGDLHIIKAIHPRDNSIEQELSRWETALPALRAIIIESGPHGGSGTPSDWDAIAQLDRTRGLLSRVHLIAAGGLHAQNVAAIIKKLRPWAVDVSSGVEESLGIKSPAKIRQFCAAVR